MLMIFAYFSFFVTALFNCNYQRFRSVQAIKESRCCFCACFLTVKRNSSPKNYIITAYHLVDSGSGAISQSTLLFGSFVDEKDSNQWTNMAVSRANVKKQQRIKQNVSTHILQMFRRHETVT